MTQKEKLQEAQELAVRYIGNCEFASLEIGEAVAQLEEALSVPMGKLTAADLVRAGEAISRIKDELYDMEPTSEHKWYRKENQ